MTRLLIAYDGSPSAKRAIAFASALFESAEAVVAHVHAPPPSPESGAIARVALPDAVIRDGIERMRADAQANGRKLVDEGTEIARAAGLDARAELRFATTPWRELQAVGNEVDADVLVTGTHGHSPLERMMVGSTASSLLHHAERPLLVVPDGEAEPGGPIVAGYDASDGARKAIDFAAAHLRTHPLLIAHAWKAPMVLTVPAEPAFDLWQSAAAEVAEEGVALAREAGLDAAPITPDGTPGQWRALLAAAAERGAAAVLVGSRGRGAVTSTVLGSVASGLVHAATLPVLVVP